MKKYGVIFLFFFLAGCEVILDIDVPFPQAQLTLNSFFHADSLWTASVSLNQGILDESFAKRVEDAVVIIYHENVPIDTLAHVVNGVYRSDSGRPILGEAYEIKAMASEYVAVTGHSHIPLPAPVSSVDITDGTSIEGSQEKTLRVKFRDDPQAVNYYQLFLESESEYIDAGTGELVVRNHRISFWSDDPIVQDDEIGYDGVFLKDVFFTDGNGVVSVKIPGFDFGYNSAITLVLRTVSEDFYNYKITGSLQESSSDNPFAQPVNVYSNIENGFGIFAGFSGERYIIKEAGPRPVITSITPLKGKRGDHVLITGENFSGFPNVLFTAQRHLTSAQIVRGTETELEVIIPPNAASGKIYVNNDGRYAISDVEFEVMD